MQLFFDDEISNDWEPEVDARFFHWLGQVDEYLVTGIGLDHNDLPDQPYADWYAEEMSAQEAANNVLREMGAV